MGIKAPRVFDDLRTQLKRFFKFDCISPYSKEECSERIAKDDMRTSGKRIRSFGWDFEVWSNKDDDFIIYISRRNKIKIHISNPFRANG